MTSLRAINVAVDLARMPALAQSVPSKPLPADILHAIQIAAGSPEHCQAGAAATGLPRQALIEACRFYLQHLLFRPDADCYHVLGLEAGSSREVARTHLRWLMLWLHPDQNDGLESVYATRVLSAWREIAATSDGHRQISPIPRRSVIHTATRTAGRFRLPWIELPHRAASDESRAVSGLRIRSVATTLAVTAVFLLLGASGPALGWSWRPLANERASIGDQCSFDALACR